MMFKKLTTLFAFMAGSLAFSQVGIQTQTPHASADLELGSTNKALYLNRVANPQTDIANPQPGMMLYDTTLGCVRAYQGNPPAWSDCIDLGLGGQEGSISSFDCNAAVFSPATATMGTAYSGYLYLPYTGGNGGRYPEDDFTVAGLRFHLPEGTYNTGSSSLTYQVTGTPTSSGTISVDINQNGASCTGLTFSVNPPVGTVSALTCASVAFAPITATMGTAYTGTLVVPYTGGNGGTYPAQSFTTNGLTFTLAAGTFASGSGSVTYNISGAPVAAGTTSVNITLGGRSCTGAGSLVVNNPAPVNPVGTGSLSGVTCFDVVEINDGESCGTLTSRTSRKANFATTSSYTYTFTPTGTVSNVRFAFVNTKGQVIQSITGGNTGNVSAAINATVVYYNNLNTVAAGLTREQALLADIYVIYNNAAVGGGGSDRQLKLTARVQDCNCCGAKVSSTVWKEFLCHNLGADTAADPFTPSWKLNGAYIVWGQRGPNITGNSSVDWITAPTNISTWFIAAPQENQNFTQYIQQISGATAPPNLPANTWNAGTEAAPIKAVSDPCPSGYRIPTKTEWAGVIANNTYTLVGPPPPNGGAYYAGSGAMFGTSLYLPLTGTRDWTGAYPGYSLNSTGDLLSTWSSLLGTIFSTNDAVETLNVNGRNRAPSVGPIYACSMKSSANTVRCIAE